MATAMRDAAGIGLADLRLTPIEEPMVEGVERLLDLSFGYDRHQRTAYRLRERVAADRAASCAALDTEGRLVGSLQTWPVALRDGDAPETPLWLIGPIAVHPDRRDQGVGRAMIAHALDAIDLTPWAAVLIGDAPYYARFGFAADATGGWQLPGPVDRARLLARVLPGRTLPRQGVLGPRR